MFQFPAQRSEIRVERRQRNNTPIARIANGTKADLTVTVLEQNDGPNGLGAEILRQDCTARFDSCRYRKVEIADAAIEKKLLMLRSGNQGGRIGVACGIVVARSASRGYSAVVLGFNLTSFQVMVL